ncbi:MAG: hypothetical protein GX638_01250, partial [Crenarchaeota archaeon]|nr:hypothetical protein [Thermoproteota archaeon]
DKTVTNGTILGPFFEGFTIEITKPDGSVETKGPYTADSTGGSWFSYTPTMAGQYTFQTFFPGQTFTHLNPTRYYEPSQSKIQTIMVQEEPVPSYPTEVLPSGYWTRPIYGEIKDASSVADNWLMQGYNYNGRTFAGTTAFAPYTSAPNSAHILWTKEIMLGGIVGGPFEDQTYYTGLSYEQPYLPLILSGRLIYSDARQVIGPGGGTHCVDLKTGEEIWYLNGTDITFAQTYAYSSPNEHGIIPHLVSVSGSTWRFYNPFDGKYQFSISNVSSGTMVIGPKGEMLVYSLTGSGANRRYLMWNSSLALQTSGAINDPAVTGYGINTYSPAAGATYNGINGYQWNVSLPNVGYRLFIQMVGEGVVIASTGMVGTPQDLGVYPLIYPQVGLPAAIEKLANGNYPTSINFLWTANRTNIYGMYERLSKNIGDGVYTMYDEATMTHHAYDITTGSELWVTEPYADSDFGTFSRDYHIAYGKLYSAGYDGILRAFSLTNGEQLWSWYFGSAGYETPYGTWPVYNGFTIAEGKIYISNDEHSPDSTLWRGGRLVCIDAEEGEELWSLSGWLRIPAISDGVLTAVNAYDNQIYTLGKGPSKTIVEAPMSGVTVGSVITIRGSVTDQTPATKDTPAIADEFMSEWMSYLYQQKAMPTNAIGVPVKITVIDENGQSTVIGEVTSDIGGSYGIQWSPPAQGTYQILAEFAGTESYGNSYATTYLSVASASSSVSSPSITSSPSASVDGPSGTSTETLLIAAVVAVIIVVVIAIAIILRKQK